MHVKVDNLDLQEEFSNLPTSKIEIKHFKPEVQRVISLALSVEGCTVTFFEYDRSSYNALHRPVE